MTSFEEAKIRSRRRIDSDLGYACEAGAEGDNGFRLRDVAYVLAEIQGENDGPSWHWIIAMKDHTYAYVTGWCDYTGWGCQDGGDAIIFPTLIEALNAVDEEYRVILKSQLTGDTPFGADK